MSDILDILKSTAAGRAPLQELDSATLQSSFAEPSGYAIPSTIIEVRAGKIADEIFAALSDDTTGELTQHQLVSAIIARELKSQNNA